MTVDSPRPSRRNLRGFACLLTTVGAPVPLPSASPAPAPSARAPWRLWVAKGSTKDVTILDAVLGPIVDEHNWRNADTGRWDSYAVCSGRGCPLCESPESFGTAKRSMLMTCTDASATSYDPRRLMEVRSKQIVGVLEKALKEHGTIRGVRLRLVRDEAEKSSLGTTMYQGRDPGTLPEACHYASLFRTPTATELRARHGIAAPEDKSDGDVRYVRDEDDLMVPW